jgi:hypothetical protein
MVDFDIFQTMKRLSYRYGTRVNLTDLDNGSLGLEDPTAESASRDYFRENSPSAARRPARFDDNYSQQPYLAGEEAVAGDGITIFAVLLVIAGVALFAAYFFVPSIHLQIDALLHH